MAYSKEYAISTYRKYRVYLTASVTSNTNTTSVVSYTAQFQMTNAYHYGCKLSVSGGKTVTGVLNSNPGSSWVTVCTASGTINVARGTSAKTHTVTAVGSGTSVSGYGGVPGSVSVSVNVTIPALPTYTISYNANGGSGAPASQTKRYGQNLSLSSTKPTRTGYVFLGWSTSSTATEATYLAGATYTANAGATLYAVWKIGKLQDFEFSNVSVSIPSKNTILISQLANPTAFTIPYTPVKESDLATTNYYYKVCYVDNINGDVANIDKNYSGTVYGPFTQSNYSSSSSTGAKAIPISANLLRQSILNCKSETEVKFLVIVCTGSNTFEKDICTKHLVTVNLTNFSILNCKVISSWRTGDSTCQIKLQIKFPKSYTTSHIASVLSKGKEIGYAINEIGNNSSSAQINSSSVDSNNVATVIVNSESNTFNSTDLNLVSFDIKDGLFESVAITRIGGKGAENIYLCKNNQIKAVEFIEDPSVKTPFQKGGKVYANEFIEIDDGILIGNTIYCGEIVEM